MQSRDNIEEPEVNLLSLLHVLVLRKMLVIKICTVAIIASVVYSLTLPNIYSATAKVLPPQKEGGGGLSSLLQGQAAGLAALAGGGLAGGSDLYVGILKSRSVADAVIKTPVIASAFEGKTMDEARDKLKTVVKIQAGKDGIISITAEDKDPKRSALLANTFVEELGKITVRLNLSKAGTERQFLEKRLELVRSDLKAAEDDLKGFAQSNRVVQVDSQAKASIEAIARLKGELATKEVQLAALSTRQTEQSPEVKAVHSSIRQLRSEVAALSGNSGSSEGIPSIGNVPGMGLEYSRKLRELKSQEAIFEQLTKQYEMVKINEAKDSTSFQVLDEAVVPVKKSKPMRAKIVIMSALVAFFVSLCIVFAQEYLAKMSEEDRKLVESIKKGALRLK